MNLPKFPSFSLKRGAKVSSSEDDADKEKDKEKEKEKPEEEEEDKEKDKDKKKGGKISITLPKVRYEFILFQEL